MLVHQHDAKLGALFGWVFERGQDDGAFVDREPERLYVFGERARSGWGS